MQTRYYDPTICRFINADNYELIAQLSSTYELNLYTYCGNNPIMRVDPSGEGWLSDLWESVVNWFRKTFDTFIDLSHNIVSRVEDYFFFGYEEGLSLGGSLGETAKPFSFYVSQASEWWKFWEYKIGLKIRLDNFNMAIDLSFKEMKVSFGNEESIVGVIAGFDKIALEISYIKNQTIYYSQSYVRTIPTLMLIMASHLSNLFYFVGVSFV